LPLPGLDPAGALCSWSEVSQPYLSESCYLLKPCRIKKQTEKDEIDACKIFVGKLEGRNGLEDLEGNIKIELKEVGWRGGTDF
jgi:hypothetical protein